MADIYVRSTDGSDADNGSTWALAKATATGAAAIDAAGDRIFISSSHDEVTAAAITIALAGTAPLPSTLVSVNDSAAPPTAVVEGAQIRASGSTSAITISGAAAYYVAGLTLIAGESGTGTASINITGSGTASHGLVERCKLRCASTGVSSRVAIPSSGSMLRVVDTTVRFSNASQGVGVGGGRLQWDGGGVETGGTSPTVLFPAFNGTAELSRLDLSACSSTFTIFSGTAAAAGRAVIRNSKLPASWTGSLASSVLPQHRFELYNCDSADTNYRLWVEEYAGSTRSETTIVRTGGATDGTVPFSWRMASNANAEFPVMLVTSAEIAAWNETTGSAITVSVEIITDGVTLNDDECWLEVQYLGNSGFPLGSLASDAKADVLASAAAQTTSTETWTTTGLSSPVKQKLSVTFTPQEAGYLQAVVKLAKASTTVYVDPLLTVT